MVRITDGLRRPIYVLDGKERLHPFTYEIVTDDFEYKHPQTFNPTVAALPFIILFFGIIAAVIMYLFNN